MLPSVLVSQLQQGVEDFLRTTFPSTTPHFHGMLDRFFERDGSVFKGPYVNVQLPFAHSGHGSDYFPKVPLQFPPYTHQAKAFERLGGESRRSTLVATGTGSGKTEAFLWPILDHVRSRAEERGIKAIIIYPMNALATDQAGRIAEAVHEIDALDGVRVGLYVGDEEENPHVTMGAEHVITSRDTMRLDPPDVLLTNYKMLDYLLTRPADARLWRYNEPDTLQYLVVDELHTFDGAQGTDLACLIRRLKDRLGTPEGALCCVGTSAMRTPSAGTPRRSSANRLGPIRSSARLDSPLRSSYNPSSTRTFQGRTTWRLSVRRRTPRQSDTWRPRFRSGSETWRSTSPHTPAVNSSASTSGRIPYFGTCWTCSVGNRDPSAPSLAT